MTDDIQMFLVGGAVRDFKLGVKTKDYDYSVVVDSKEPLTADEAYAKVLRHLYDEGYEVFLTAPEYYTIRARFPRLGEFDTRRGLTADFVLARAEGPYSDGRRPDWVKPGTLEDDLARRDFSVNAMALDFNNDLIDPFNGEADLVERRLRAVGDPAERLTEDALRAFRAVRFAITKGFSIDPELAFAMRKISVLDALEKNISAERIKDELHKCFAYDTVATIRLLYLMFPDYLDIMQRKGIWLAPSMKDRK